MKKVVVNFILPFSVLCMVFVQPCTASAGDSTPFFHNCRQNCERQNCSSDGLEIQEQAQRYYRQSVFDKAFYWTCADECQYGCMWRTVDAFLERGWNIPQFYGKWPFVRFLGLQEPASVFFSILNFIAHYRMLRKLRREVRQDSPCFYLWHVFSFICLNGWVWSTVFHTRDFPLTELLDYAFAYSMVLAMLYCMIMRMFIGYSFMVHSLITVAFLSLYVEYFAFLSIGKFSYSLNMQANIITGVITSAGWILWCFMVAKRRPYYRKMIRFYFLFAISICLELLDFPPILWIFDAHALWHLATVPVTTTLYSFIIDDCKALRNEKQLQDEAEKYKTSIQL